MSLPFEEAVAELMTLPDLYSSQSLVLAKVRTQDGRVAVIQIEITTDPDVVTDAEVWTPR